MNREDMSSFIKLIGIAFHYYTDFNVISMKMTFKEDKEYLKMTFSDESQKIIEITEMNTMDILRHIIRMVGSNVVVRSE